MSGMLMPQTVESFKISDEVDLPVFRSEFK